MLCFLQKKKTTKQKYIIGLRLLELEKLTLKTSCYYISSPNVIHFVNWEKKTQRKHSMSEL